MNKKILESLNITPKRIRKKGTVHILDDEYVIKKIKNPKLKETYNYLKSRNFLNFPPVITEQDGYEVTKYLQDVKIDDTQKIEDMIYLLTLLQNKTTFYKEVDLDEVKKIYEETREQLEYLYHYYQTIQTMIEEEIYMSPANYYFILRISKIYQVLNLGLFYIEKWYEQAHNKKTMRFVLNHNNLTSDHIIEQDNVYLTSWGNSSFGFPEADLENLWMNNYEYLELDNLLQTYQSKYKLYDDEYYLFLAKLCTLKKIDFNKEEQVKMKEIINLMNYLEKLELFFSKQNPKESNY